jgi:hypothetical protein
MEAWRKVWREGFAPQLSTDGLEALRKALEADDPSLIQRATTSPPPLACVTDWPVEGACAVAYGIWKGGGTGLVGDVEEAFAKACFNCDEALDETAGCRWFLNFFDDTPRDEVRRLLVPEVVRELNRRRREEVSA